MGWVVFAGTMVGLVGGMSCVLGIAAISSSRFYTDQATFILGDLNTWGWVLVGIGAVQLVSAFPIWLGSEWGKWVGLISAGFSAIALLLFLPAHQLAALMLFAVDILVIYGLAAYGGHKAGA